MAHKTNTRYELASVDNIITVSDVRRLLRYLNSLDDTIHQNSISESGFVPNVDELDVSSYLLNVASKLQCDLNDKADRTKLRSFLHLCLKRCPVIHINCASEMSQDVKNRLISWFRSEIDEWSLFDFAIQPSLIMGFTVRTPNKFFDLSARKKLNENATILRHAIENMEE